MPTSAKTPTQQSNRYPRYIQAGLTSATHLSRWVHPNGTTKSHRSPSINVLNQYAYVRHGARLTRPADPTG
jgi:hypothetical protein